MGLGACAGFNLPYQITKKVSHLTPGPSGLTFVTSALLSLSRKVQGSAAQTLDLPEGSELVMFPAEVQWISLEFRYLMMMLMVASGLVNIQPARLSLRA